MADDIDALYELNESEFSQWLESQNQWVHCLADSPIACRAMKIAYLGGKMSTLTTVLDDLKKLPE